MNKNLIARIIIIITCYFGCSAMLWAQSNKPSWEVSPYDYQYDMTIYAKLVVDSIDVNDLNNYVVGAFVNDECRAISETVTQSGITWLYIRVRSNKNSGEIIKFKLFYKSTGEIKDIIETQEFKSDALLGLPSEPYPLNVIDYIVGDVNNDKEIDVSDVQELIDIILIGDTPVSQETCDYNKDGEIDISDVQELIDYILNN